MGARYQFKAGVYLVTGAARGAILDTKTSLVYSINQRACMVSTYGLEYEPFWHTLESIGIAEQTKDPIQQLLPERVNDSRLKFIWFEIVTNDCNERCIHCYTDSMPKSYRKVDLSLENHLEKESPPTETLPKKRMVYDDWLKAIKESNNLGCNSCQFIGGEPQLYHGENGETVFNLAAYAREVGYLSIEIFTNATCLPLPKFR